MYKNKKSNFTRLIVNYRTTEVIETDILKININKKSNLFTVKHLFFTIFILFMNLVMHHN